MLKLSLVTAATLFKIATAAPITGQVNEFAGDQDLPFFYPSSEMETFVPTEASRQSTLSEEESLKLATQKVMEKINVSEQSLKIASFNKDSAGVMHVYFNHVVNGIDVENHHASIHLLGNQVVSQTSSFNGNSEKLQKRGNPVETTVSLEKAIQIAVEKYGIERDEFPATTAYMETKDGVLALTHKFQLRDDKVFKWYLVLVDATTGDILSTTNYYNSATYDVIKLPKVDARDGFEQVTNPHFKEASPNGWHQVGSTKYTNTRGNNVDSRIGNLRIDGGQDLNFPVSWDATAQPDTANNKAAAIINNFYVSNMMHDITYAYGFDESSGNFQNDNEAKGGSGNDYVLVNNHAFGSNNANFATPPDGQNPTMNMFLWTLSTPKRDGSLDNSVPAHEYGHGVSNRLTGGRNAASCLRTTEAGGMGEGWSDAFAAMLTMKESDTNKRQFGLGAYVYNNPIGIRKYPYSTDMTVNPLTYGDIKGMSQVHSIGTVWNTILWDVYWALVDVKGFSPDWFNSKQNKGNIIMMQNMIGGMKLHPCNPTFIQARDAILAADDNYYGGVNKCTMWKGFAKRGLGTDAANSVSGYKMPAFC